MIRTSQIGCPSDNEGTVRLYYKTNTNLEKGYTKEHMEPGIGGRYKEDEYQQDQIERSVQNELDWISLVCGQCLMKTKQVDNKDFKTLIL